MNHIGNMADILGVIGALVAAVASVASWRAQRCAMKLARETITVSLAIGGEEEQIVLPLEIVRRDLSRAELLGRMGMLPVRNPSGRFQFKSFSNPAVMRDLNRVLAGETSLLVIPASREEVDQFDL